MTSPNKRGRFITLEGGEGVGKSTQIKALSTALRAQGLDVIETREPGGTPGAEHIRQLLLHSEADAWSPRAEALLFAAARSDHVERLIEPALAGGKWVLCDRFIDSTRAYQGGGDGLSDAEIVTLHTIGSKGLLPDRTLLLTLDADAIAARRAARHLDQPDRFEDRQTDFHAGVTAAFERMAEGDPARFRGVSADGTAEEVTARLVDALADLL
jgi:dTMP kinase